ncbi:MAG: aminodeoxychorismate synthase component I [Gammaproteobacteria bacterium]|nr:MAG: aminodeoxychorismate synthase component I [Gammaproteobacteria bacterium]
MQDANHQAVILLPQEESPDLLALHHRHPHRYPFLLESVAHGTPQARFDILFAFPQATMTLTGLDTVKTDYQENPGHDFLHELDNWWSQQRVDLLQDCPVPFHGGWFLYLGYELAGQVEPGLKLPLTATSMPTAFATRIPAAIIHDHDNDKSWLMIERGQHNASQLLEQMAADIRAHDKYVAVEKIHHRDLMTEEDPQTYLDRVHKILGYIREGDVFQVNLSRRWDGDLESSDEDVAIYSRLKKTNPAPFAGLARYNDICIMSTSPERLISINEHIIQTRPIAGTRPRSNDQQHDQAYSEELLGHPKERAEHIMLIDLERNDLGRVCEPGSIHVSELMILESYAHVHHIVSNVQGKLRDDVTPGQAIRATFPGGTITGCPKVRCMEIIAELEQESRGPYTGSMGYLNRDGSLDLNILIRTLLRQGSHVILRAGAGIVADSDPRRELEETRSKAKGLLLALE